jgi:hypothetical protein
MSKKYLMVIAKYPDWRQEFFEKYMSPRNKEYSKLHDFEYLEYTDNLEWWRGNPTWLKFKIVDDLIEENFLKDGDIITHIDADMCIAKLDEPLATKKSFSYSIDSGNTHCMGFYSLKINTWSRELIKLILDEERFNNLKDLKSTHDYFGHYNSFWEEFREQASWYSLAGIKRHSQKSFFKLPNNGWHSEVDEWTKYSIEELNKHVEILPTSWNVTEMKGESSCNFLINKTFYNNVRIRHFAGAQPWRSEWFETNNATFHLKHLNPLRYLNPFPLNFINPRRRKLIKKKIKKLAHIS